MRRSFASQTLRVAPSFILYQIRLVCSWAYPVLLLVGAGTTLLLARQYQPDALRSFYQIFETLLPLAASFLFVPLILIEQQRRTLALVSVTQCSLPLLFAVRLLFVLLFLALVYVILALLIRLAPPVPEWMALPPDPASVHERDLKVWPASRAGGPHGILAVVLTLGAPTALLGGIGVALAHATADARTGYLAIFVVWMLNRTTGVTLDEHPLLRSIFLFVRSGGTGDWLTPKLIQLGIGIGLFVLAWFLTHRSERLLRAS
ncbi:MAG: hypothetical protein RMJ55_05830 [Roseiflexaceae bacterium]|nr:hypothetical protein [Roseiflexaceae bacterium]